MGRSRTFYFYLPVFDFFFISVSGAVTFWLETLMTCMTNSSEPFPNCLAPYKPELLESLGETNRRDHDDIA